MRIHVCVTACEGEKTGEQLIILKKKAGAGGKGVDEGLAWQVHIINYVLTPLEQVVCGEPQRGAVAAPHMINGRGLRLRLLSRGVQLQGVWKMNQSTDVASLCISCSRKEKKIILIGKHEITAKARGDHWKFQVPTRELWDSFQTFIVMSPVIVNGPGMQ